MLNCRSNLRVFSYTIFYFISLFENLPRIKERKHGYLRVHIKLDLDLEQACLAKRNALEYFGKFRSQILHEELSCTAYCDRQFACKVDSSSASHLARVVSRAVPKGTSWNACKMCITHENALFVEIVLLANMLCKDFHNRSFSV